MANSFDPQDLMDDAPQSFLANQKADDPPTAPLKKVEILDHEALNQKDELSDTEDDGIYTSRKKKRRDDEFNKQELEAMQKEIVEADKLRSPWESTISPRSLRSKVISYQAKALSGIVKPLTCENHTDTLLTPIMETTQVGERVILRCSVITCMHRIEIGKDARLVNHICDNSE